MVVAVISTTLGLCPFSCTINDSMLMETGKDILHCECKLELLTAPSFIYKHYPDLYMAVACCKTHNFNLIVSYMCALTTCLSTSDSPLLAIRASYCMASI